MTTSSAGKVKWFFYVVLIIVAVWQVSWGLNGEPLVSAPSDMGFVSLAARSILVLSWVIVLGLTPISFSVFIFLFIGFSAMFLANTAEWIAQYMQLSQDFIVLYEVERVVAVAFASVGIWLWSHERRREDLSLRTLSATDSLTGLYNTRYFYQELEQEIRRVRRYGRELSLALIRVDRFREYNDLHGYSEGDRVLKEMGQFILGYLRRSDLGCRFGANEFAILLPETPLAGAALVGQRLRDRLTSMSFEIKGKEYHLNLSVAIVQLRRDEAPLGLVRRAEALLEEATRQGGGIVLKE